jgi:hypothetical protein
MYLALLLILCLLPTDSLVSHSKRKLVRDWSPNFTRYYFFRSEVHELRTVSNRRTCPIMSRSQWHRAVLVNGGPSQAMRSARGKINRKYAWSIRLKCDDITPQKSLLRMSHSFVLPSGTASMMAFGLSN